MKHARDALMSLLRPMKKLYEWSEYRLRYKTPLLQMVEIRWPAPGHFGEDVCWCCWLYKRSGHSYFDITPRFVDYRLKPNKNLAFLPLPLGFWCQTWPYLHETVKLDGARGGSDWKPDTMHDLYQVLLAYLMLALSRLARCIHNSCWQWFLLGCWFWLAQNTNKQMKLLKKDSSVSWYFSITKQWRFFLCYKNVTINFHELKTLWTGQIFQTKTQTTPQNKFTDI